MFEGLYEIDWASFGKHIAAALDSKDIPIWINQLLSDASDERTESIECLFGHGQHSGMIVKTTPLIIPFALEVLAQPHYPEKASLLRKLKATGYHIFLAGNNIADLRLSLMVYDALATGLPIFLKLLTDDDDATRFYAAQSLKYFQESAFEVLTALINQFTVESHERIRVTIIRSVMQLLADARLIYNKNYSVFWDFIITRSRDGVDSVAEQFAAADSIINMRYEHLLDKELTEHIQTIVREFKSQKKKYGDLGNPMNFYPI